MTIKLFIQSSNIEIENYSIKKYNRINKLKSLNNHLLHRKGHKLWNFFIYTSLIPNS